MQLPHTGQILLIDNHNFVNNVDMLATYTVPADHPVLEGHFPHIKIWPGVYLVEGMNQCAGLHAMYLAEHAGLTTNNSFTAMVTSVDKAKFRKPVFPNSLLTYTASLVKRRKNHLIYDCEVLCNGEKVAQATVGLTAR